MAQSGDNVARLEEYGEKLKRYSDLATDRGWLTPEEDVEREELRRRLRRNMAWARPIVDGVVGRKYEWDLAFDESNPEFPVSQKQALDDLLDGVTQAIGIIELSTHPSSPEVRGVYGKGETWYAYRDIKAIIEGAKARLTIVDAYVEDRLWDLLGAAQGGIDIRVLTRSQKSRKREFRLFKLEGEKFKRQRENSGRGTVQVRTSDEVHDRWIIADERVFLCGPSIKDAGEKGSAIVEVNDLAQREGSVKVVEKSWGEASVVL
jgi:hypothetical protein